MRIEPLVTIVLSEAFVMFRNDALSSTPSVTVLLAPVGPRCTVPEPPCTLPPTSEIGVPWIVIVAAVPPLLIVVPALLMPLAAPVLRFTPPGALIVLPLLPRPFAPLVPSPAAPPVPPPRRYEP